MVVHQAEDGERALRVGCLTITLVLAISPGTDVLVQALCCAHPVIQPKKYHEWLIMTTVAHCRTLL